MMVMAMADDNVDPDDSGGLWLMTIAGLRIVDDASVWFSINDWWFYYRWLMVLLVMVVVGWMDC